MIRRRPLLRLSLASVVLALTLSACTGVVDRDGSALDPPPGGWEPHGPG